VTAWEDIVTGVSPFCHEEIARRENLSQAESEADTSRVWERHYFDGVHTAFNHVLKFFWCLVSLTLSASTRIVDTSFIGSARSDLECQTNLVQPTVYCPAGPREQKLWAEALNKISQMLWSNDDRFTINGKDVNSASHATYSHALRNNELWCGVLQEVGWYLQEIMRSEYLYFEPEGIELFGVDRHIHPHFFTNQNNWRLPSPYDIMLETQHEETERWCNDMRRKYRQMEENNASVKRERDHLNHTIAQFLAERMSSSPNITTRIKRLGEVRGVLPNAQTRQDLRDLHAHTSEGDKNIAGLVRRMRHCFQ
jgi:hypothetical protein